ncbi:YebC/PmpR family DNA-binding transcriptional regulator [Candidatus Gracilibacteria bacterium]|nr:YebC/PmpR family DNA-binding transcriptional regulator [Candidatus Gracilibacteria bacterium]
MAGHSKWANIKHRKGAQDKIKGKIYGKHSKLLAIAARGGADPETNNALKLAIENAKAVNVPNDNIKKAIEKGSGTGKNAATYVEGLYEAYGPGGVAIIVSTLSDNSNRTITDVKTIISKKGGNFAESGSVSYMFGKKGEITVDLEGKDIEEFEMFVLDSGAEDFEVFEDEKIATVITEVTDFTSVRDKITSEGYTLKGAEISWIPNQKVPLDNEEKLEKLNNLIEALEENDDVDNVYTNLEN